MITDKTLEFAAENTEVEGEGEIGAIIDNKEKGGFDKDIFIVGKASADFTGGSSLALNIETSDTEDFDESEVLLAGKDIPLAELKEGAILLKQRLPVNVKRYMRAVIVGSAVGGKVWIVGTDAVDKDIND